MWNDPIIEEIRKIRFSIAEECQGNSSEILRRAMALQKKYANRLVSKPKYLDEKPLISTDLSQLTRIHQQPELMLH